MDMNKEQQQIINIMTEWANAIGVKDSFIPYNHSIIRDLNNPKKVIGSLIDKNILQFRKCEGSALEFTQEYINNNLL